MRDNSHRTAQILSLIATAISHDVNPRAYLHLVARHIVDGWPNARLRDLLPDRMLAVHPELYVGENVALLANADGIVTPATGAPWELPELR